MLRTSETRARRRAWRPCAALTLTAAMALTACSSSSGDATDAEADTKIAIAISSPPRSLDPAQLDGGNQAYFWASIFDTLLYLDNDGEIQPNAAEAWEYSDDRRTLTLALREGMTFSTGEPVDAAAVKATLERHRVTPGQQQPKMWSVESIDTPDDLTVVLHLSSPDHALLSNLAMELGVIGDPATLDTERTATDPVASGPYVLNTSETVTGSTYVLERREDHWNVDAYPFQTLTISVMQDPTAATNSLRAGQVDVTTVPAGQLPTVEGEGKFTVNRIPVQSVAYLNLADRNGTKLAPLADVRVRQAINMAFDREPMVKQLLSGVGRATPQLFNPNSPAYVPALEDAYEYDPEAARALLADAGFPDGFDISMPSTVVSTAFEPTITQFLADIGIDVTWDAVPPQNVTSSVASGDYPMYFFLVSSEPTPGREIQRQLHSVSQNPFQWTSDELEELELAAGEALDPQEQEDAFAAIGEYVSDQALFAPLFYVGTAIVTASDITYLGDGSNVLPGIRTFEPAE